VGFIFLVLHWPERDRRDALAQSMRDLIVATPGCLTVEPPFVTDDGSCLVGISKWEFKEAFLGSGITLRPPDEIVEGETRPRQRFLLEEAGLPPSDP
jgi:hypothetical protein